METTTVSSVLDAVTVYAQGAVCTRLARLPAAAPRAVRIAGLPLTLDEGSVRARVVSGPAGLAVTGVRTELDAELPPEPDVAAEQRALEEAQDAAGELELQLSTAHREIARIASLRPAFPPRRKSDPPREAPVAAVLELAGFVDGELQSLHRRRLDLERRLVDARHDVDLRGNRLAEASSAKRFERARLTRAAVVSLAVPEQDGEAELAVEYLVRATRWTPGYDLRLAPDMASGSLLMRASIAQRSGEDWKDVRLSVSTADLSRSTDVPELRSLRVGRSQPAPPRSGWREPPPGLDELFAPYDEALRRRPQPEAAASASRPARRPMPQAEEILAELSARGEAAGEGAWPEAEAAEPSPDAFLMDMTALAASAPPPAAPPSCAPPPFARREAEPPPSAWIVAEPPPSMSAFAPRPMPTARRGPALPVAAAASRLMRSRAPASRIGAGVDRDDGSAETAAMAPDAMASEPEMHLGDELTDYDRLALLGAQPGTARGILARCPEPPPRGFVASTSVSVQVNVLAVLVTQARADAGEAMRLPSPPHAVPLRQSAGSYDYRYDARHRVDVAADGTWHTVPIGTAEVTLQPRYLSVPSMENRVYRTLVVRNASSQAVLAGGADVTLGNEFLMTVPFPAVAPRGEERVGLGVEEAIKISRNTSFNETTGGLLGGSSVLNHEIAIEVANRLGHPVEVEVRERVPVVGHDDIKVEEVHVDPSWKADEGIRDGVVARGARTWLVSLPAGATAALSARYVIKLPSGKVLMGGNRRV